MNRTPFNRPLNQNGAEMGLNCPKCQSDQVQSINVIVSSGTSLTSGTVTGLSNGGAGIGTMSGVSQTNLAARFSKPKGPSLFLTIWLSLGMVFGAVMLGRVSGFASIIPLAIMAFFIKKHFTESKEYKNKLAIWENLYHHGFFCHRCGNTFTA